MAENEYGEWVPDNWREADPATDERGNPVAIDPMGDVFFPGGNRYGQVTYTDETGRVSQYPSGWGENSPREIAGAGQQRYGPAWSGILGNGGNYALAANPTTGQYYGGPWGSGGPPVGASNSVVSSAPSMGFSMQPPMQAPRVQGQELPRQPRTPWERYLWQLWQMGLR